jgi:DNA-3-methyladenine glycosylase II
MNVDEKLIAIDQRFTPWIELYGPCSLPSIPTKTSCYEVLINSILGQQISRSAAEAHRKKLFALFPGEAFPPPDALLAKTPEELREAGISRQKASYLHDLARHFYDLPKSFEFDELSDEQIIERLIPVKGIGRWSVEMFLMFHLGRLDVLPIDDMAVQEGLKKLLNLETRPKPKVVTEHAEQWRPIRSVASWYLWRIYAHKPEQKPNQS